MTQSTPYVRLQMVHFWSQPSERWLLQLIQLYQHKTGPNLLRLKTWTKTSYLLVVLHNNDNNVLYQQWFCSYLLWIKCPPLCILSYKSIKSDQSRTSWLVENQFKKYFSWILFSGIRLGVVFFSGSSCSTGCHRKVNESHNKPLWLPRRARLWWNVWSDAGITFLHADTITRSTCAWNVTT